ncbi:MAG: hypothetical protein BMS9Abin11_1783 [Gammaproteobacteria bacterium]|nr:MAG: hypothetical protein BMS9Abin11_1783 [Gammaproteobacteria bacterium]
MKVIEQLCIKSFEITAQNGDYFKVHQGKIYTTTIPKDKKDIVTVFSNYWVGVPKTHFVLQE